MVIMRFATLRDRDGNFDENPPAVTGQLNALLTLLNSELTLVPRLCTVVMIAAAIPAAISAYSMVVAPSSLAKNNLTRASMPQPPGISRRGDVSPPSFDSSYEGLKRGGKSSINSPRFLQGNVAVEAGNSRHFDQFGAWAGGAAIEEARRVMRRARQRRDVAHRACAGPAVTAGRGGRRTADRNRRLMRRARHEPCWARPVAFACSNHEPRNST